MFQLSDNMKKGLYIFIFLCFASRTNAQQSVLYSQFMLNDYGLNPAVAGSSKDWNFMVGRRTQWRGFAFAPETNFASVVKDFGKKGYRRYWHGAGIYIEQDKFGLFTTKIANASYATHLRVSSKYFLSFGISAGVKSADLSSGLFDPNDPALIKREAKVVVPDIVPGVYLYSHKASVGFSVKNLYSYQLKQGKKEIGSPSKIPAVAYITATRRFSSPGYDFVYVPAIQVQSAFTSLPITQFNFMTYYRKRVGLGVTYRMHDALCAMLQIYVLPNVVIGFSYDYTISKFRSAKANSTEIMMGFIPTGNDDDFQGRANVAQCPKFDY